MSVSRPGADAPRGQPDREAGGEAEGRGAERRVEAEQVAEPDAAECRVGDAARDARDAPRHDERPDHAAGDAREEAGDEDAHGRRAR